MFLVSRTGEVFVQSQIFVAIIGLWILDFPAKNVIEITVSILTVRI